MTENALTCEYIIRMLKNYGGQILGHHNDQLIIGVSRKLSQQAKAELELLCDYNIRFKTLDHIDHCEVTEEKVKSSILSQTNNQKSYRITSNKNLFNPEHNSLFSNDLNIYDILNDFISQAINDDACDIHIDRRDQIITMEYRKSDLCRAVKIQHLSVTSSLMSLLNKLVEGKEIDNSDYQIGYFKVSNGIRDLYIYVSILSKIPEEKIVLHIQGNNCRGPRYSPVQVHDNSPPVQLFSDMIQKLSY